MNEENKNNLTRPPMTSEDELKQLIEKNLLLTNEIYEMTKKIKSYITFQKIMSAFYFLIIVVPLILSILYLPPLLKGLIGPYQELLGSGNGLDNILKAGGNLNPQDLSSQLKKIKK